MVTAMEASLIQGGFLPKWLHFQSPSQYPCYSTHGKEHMIGVCRNNSDHQHEFIKYPIPQALFGKNITPCSTAH
jgi:hypothetical protein